MEKRRKTGRPLPVYALIIGIGFVLLQGLLYGLALFLSRLIGTSSLMFSPKIPIIDDLFPIIPSFVLVYLFSFAFWSFGTAAVSYTGKHNFINYLIGLTLSYYLTFLVLLTFPTYIDRNAEGLSLFASRSDPFSRLLTFVYGVDGGNFGYNLLPSYHCLSSVYCYLGVRKHPEIPVGFRIYTLIMSVLICFSTLFTKQHYFLDVISATAIAILCFAAVSKLDPGKAILEKQFSKKAQIQ
ncbi:MAG: phosphatase PAP2 family protein [Clostridia bacterium]|nr:phosphatase PAP2 family protein [Clostridia bacterium]